jgi:ferric-dicitrate binding protein FerR (iron transport regulator)
MRLRSKYIIYTTEDFVEDKDFRCWVNTPNETLDSYWTSFMEEFPEKTEPIMQAKQIVNALYIEEEPVAPEEYTESLNFLKAYIDKKSGASDKISKLFVLMRNAAAILLLPTLAISTYFYQSQSGNKAAGQVVQYIVPNGQKSNVILADGTKVWLNSGSTLTVSLDNTKQRNVQLSGEAFFDVTKNEEVPFLVKTHDYSVKVYGTQFDVRAYPGQKESETILQEGSISILTDAKEEIKMTPGQSFYVDQQNKYTITEVDPEVHTSWKDNVLKIDNERLRDLLVRMEHWYGVKIQVDSYDVVKDLKYTLTIKTESLREMLDLMNYVTPLSYKIEGENVILKYKLKQ